MSLRAPRRPVILSLSLSVILNGVKNLGEESLVLFRPAVLFIIMPRINETGKINHAMTISITVYGGAGVIGGNKIFVAADNTTISFDFGISYAP